VLGHKVMREDIKFICQVLHLQKTPLSVSGKPIP
jgi:hypothetical protein